MINLPETYIESIKELLKDQYEAYLSSFSDKRTYGLRINTSKISVEEFLKIYPLIKLIIQIILVIIQQI